MGLFTTSGNFEKLFTQLDDDESGCLDFDEFKNLAKLSEASMKIIDFIPLEEVEAVEADEHSDENETEVQLRILTKQDGKNRGRTYIYNMPHDIGMVWISKLTLAVKGVCDTDKFSTVAHCFVCMLA
jgi:hypothetical protein